ncbi:ISL3 family transposase [Yersinia sp. KBS0713]|uniref:ISL3 family transposase n=1 Tax=Yersinia TaxID=629 RepID=UPI00110D4965|nr:MULTISPECIES: ISL3 family transposase [Yersinia]QDW32951.1 ISL3 family transposase [Yersinia sp. KBS0713]QDW33634.1 ISL3 family transposase [Yersinia sp. KBS0713]QDW33729.1 ISL3 family transposase [Yersinia sp. KBS0713]QDW34092.1 ISL3 family transposase [Yersinia sp. KBS0713]
MDEKSLYAHILNLSAPWQVKSVSLDENAGSVTVTVGIAEHTQLTCPTCGKSCPIHDHRHRKWRHLDTCQFTTLVEADVPRIDCPEHGCQTLPVPWAGPGSRYTLLFEFFVLSWLKISTVDAVRKQLKLSWNAVDGIMVRAVKRGLSRIKRPLSARHLCVDEVAFKKGHKYVTVISDRQGRALKLTDDRGVESLASYLRSLSDHQLDEIKTLSMDMNMAYISAARIHLPNAVDKIAFDHFHVAKTLCGVVDKTRMTEMKRISSLDRKGAHRSRYLWFYGKQNRHGGRAERLEVARLVLPETSQCWVMKELARDLWHRRYDRHSRRLWQEWMLMAKNSGIPLMASVARMVAKRLYGILNAMKHRVSNGNAESLNSKIRLLRIKSRGFRNKERFKLGVLFHYGKLNMAF